MRLCFELSMPNRGSWNGKWSGEGALYAVIVNFSNSKAGAAVTSRILANQPYYHAWSDGWGASISVREVEWQEVRKIKRLSLGFCGYEWMIENIRYHGSPCRKRKERE